MGNKTINNIKTTVKKQSVAQDVPIYKSSVDVPWAEALGYIPDKESQDMMIKQLKKRFNTDEAGVFEWDGVPVFWALENQIDQTNFRAIGFYFDAGDGFPYVFGLIDSFAGLRFLGKEENLEGFHLTPEIAIEAMVDSWDNEKDIEWRLKEQPVRRLEEMKPRIDSFKHLYDCRQKWEELPSFDNLKQAEEWIQKQPGMKSFTFNKSKKCSELTSDEVNRSMKVLADLQERLPGTIGTVEGITFISPEDYVDSEGNVIPNESTMGEAHGFFGTKIFINIGAINKYDGKVKFKDRYSFCDTLENVLYHEYGHAIDNQQTVEYIQKHLIDDATNVEDLWNQISLEIDSRTNKPRRGSRFFKSEFIPESKKAINEANKISRYSTTKSQELFAEAFTWVMNPANRDKDKKIDDNIFIKRMRDYIDNYNKALIEGYQKYQNVMAIVDQIPE